MGANVTDSLQYIGGVRRVCPGRGLVASSLVVFSLLSCVTGGHAQQGQPSPPRVSTIPTLEALPHGPLPPGRFLDWCGDRTVMEQEDLRRELYDGVVKIGRASCRERV